MGSGMSSSPGVTGESGSGSSSPGPTGVAGDMGGEMGSSPTRPGCTGTSVAGGGTSSCGPSSLGRVGGLDTGGSCGSIGVAGVSSLVPGCVGGSSLVLLSSLPSGMEGEIGPSGAIPGAGGPSSAGGIGAGSSGTSLVSPGIELGGSASAGGTSLSSVGEGSNDGAGSVSPSSPGTGVGVVISSTSQNSSADVSRVSKAVANVGLRSASSIIACVNHSCGPLKANVNRHGFVTKGHGPSALPDSGWCPSSEAFTAGFSKSSWARPSKPPKFTLRSCRSMLRRLQLACTSTLVVQAGGPGTAGGGTSTSPPASGRGTVLRQNTSQPPLLPPWLPWGGPMM